MAEFVLDASAVLAMLYDEAGGEQVVEVVSNAALSSVNAAEVIARLIRDGMAPTDAVRQIRLLPCAVEAVDEGVGFRAGELFATTRAHGLSLGDRVRIAFAERRGLIVLTADRAWKALDLPVEISLIR